MPPCRIEDKSLGTLDSQAISRSEPEDLTVPNSRRLDVDTKEDGSLLWEIVDARYDRVVDGVAVDAERDVQNNTPCPPD